MALAELLILSKHVILSKFDITVIKGWEHPYPTHVPRQSACEGNFQQLLLSRDDGNWLPLFTGTGNGDVFLNGFQ